MFYWLKKPDLTPVQLFQWILCLIKTLQASWLLPNHKITILELYYNIFQQYLSNQAWSSKSGDHYVLLSGILVKNLKKLACTISKQRITTHVPRNHKTAHINITEHLRELILKWDIRLYHPNNLQGSVYIYPPADLVDTQEYLEDLYRRAFGDFDDGNFIEYPHNQVAQDSDEDNGHDNEDEDAEEEKDKFAKQDPNDDDDDDDDDDEEEEEVIQEDETDVGCGVGRKRKKNIPVVQTPVTRSTNDYTQH
jgi:hypothetical protein